MLLTKQYFPPFYVFHRLYWEFFSAFYFENDSDLIVLGEVMLSHY